MREVQDALRGFRVRSLVPVSPPDPRKRGRATFRADLEDGRTLKVRCIEDEDAAVRLEALRKGIPDAFARILDRRGAILIEEWVEGGRPARPDAREAGVILASLHAHGRIARGDTRAWRVRSEAAADALLEPSEAQAVRARLAALDPGVADVTLVHRDFCPENMVVDARGRLRVIDNEWFARDAAGFDVGRARCRWNPRDDDWRAFLKAYGDVAAEFWVIVAALWTAELRRARGGDVAAALAFVRA